MAGSPHSDLPANVSRLWVGERLHQTCVYSGSIAYFRSMQINMEAVQLRTLNGACKQRTLTREKYLDIGCAGGCPINARHH